MMLDNCLLQRRFGTQGDVDAIVSMSCLYVIPWPPARGNIWLWEEATGGVDLVECPDL